jgi:FtsP/CotA-like multicopper oxidase with cupredoxin domain
VLKTLGLLVKVASLYLTAQVLKNIRFLRHRRLTKYQAAHRLRQRQTLRNNAKTQMQQLPKERLRLRFANASNKTRVRSCKWLLDMKT